MPDEKLDKDDERSVVESMLKVLGVDEEMKKDLIESGSLTGDVLTVETPEELRRRISLDKNSATLKDLPRLGLPIFIQSCKCKWFSTLHTDMYGFLHLSYFLPLIESICKNQTPSFLESTPKGWFF